jgi:hypothetical protein
VGTFGLASMKHRSILRMRSTRGKRQGLAATGRTDKTPIYTRSKNYQDIADPICDFILNELERITKDDRQVPICGCEGPSCNKLIMPERIGKGRFCSDACKSAHYRRKNSPSASNDYQWLYRCYALVHPDKPKAEWNEGLLRQ